MKLNLQIPWTYHTFMYYLIHFNSPKNKKLPQSGKPQDNYNLLFLLLIVFILASSCLTRKVCERRYPHNYDSVSVVTNTVTKYKDTTIYIYFKGDTVYKSSGVDEGLSELRTPIAKSIAWVKNGRINHRMIQKDTIVKYRIDNGIKETISVRERERKINRICKTGYNISWSKRIIRIGIIIVFLLIIIVIWIKFRKDSTF